MFFLFQGLTLSNCHYFVAKAPKNTISKRLDKTLPLIYQMAIHYNPQANLKLHNPYLQKEALLLNKKNKAQAEAIISEAMIKFEKEYMGRGPVETKTYLIDDMVIVRLKGVLTQAEHQLAMHQDNVSGRELIKQIRVKLLESGRPLMEKEIERILNCKVKSLHTDISTVTGERVIIFILDI